MKTFEPILILITSFALTYITLPFLRKIAIKAKLIDKPNERKLHKGLIPLVGGISLFFSMLVSLALSGSLLEIASRNLILITGSFVMLIMGVIDDKMDLRASLKLLIQLILAYYVFKNGIKIDSFYGIFGIQEISELSQLCINIILIIGVINAFNLMDGIDGLALGLAILSLISFSFVAYSLGNNFLLLLYFSMIGALIVLLKFNFSRKRKIFLGDSGSLLIGFILIVSGISMIQEAQGTHSIKLAISTVFAVLALPVLDSLRVYRRRLKNGASPFKADRNHLHHLILLLGLKHKQSSLIIVGFALVIVVIGTLIGNYLGMTISIITILSGFLIITSLVDFINNMNYWKLKIKELER